MNRFLPRMLKAFLVLSCASCNTGPVPIWEIPPRKTAVAAGATHRKLRLASRRKTKERRDAEPLNVPNAPADSALSIARQACQDAASSNSCVQKYLAKFPPFRRLVYSSGFQIAYHDCQTFENTQGEYSCIRREIAEKDFPRMRAIP